MTLTQHFKDFTRLIFPNNCAGCGNELFASTSLLCWQCINELPKTGFEKHIHNPTSSIFYGRLPLQFAFSWLFYNKGSLAQHLIHQIKYKRNIKLGKFMGLQLGMAMLETGLYNDVDVLIPLPLNKKKLAKRGYNQAMLLCQGMAEALQKPVEDVAVFRNRFTETQTKKSRLERISNVEQVFDLQDGHTLKNKHALLVDDVITTGATMESCGQILLQVPGLKLSMASLAAASTI
jgi:ComF family protein